MPPTDAVPGSFPPELAFAHVAPEWCAAESGGVLHLLFLTSVRTAWLPKMTEVIRGAASRHENERAALLCVFRLDKRYPLDIGFDQNLTDLRRAHREIAPSICASAMTLEFGGLLALAMKAAVATTSLLVKRQYPRTIHSSVVSAASWLRPHASASERRDVGHYASAVDRMRMELGCERF